MSVCLVLQLDLSRNRLCGLYYDSDYESHGTYTADGIMALAKALKVTGSLTKLDLRANELDESAKAALRAAARPALELDL